MKSILILSASIHDINKLRRFFGAGFKVTATNNPDNAVNLLKDRRTDLIVYHAVTELSGFFEFYRRIRGNKQTEKFPILAITDTQLLKDLTDTVTLTNADFIGSAITPENLQNLVNTYIDGKSN